MDLMTFADDVEQRKRMLPLTLGSQGMLTSNAQPRVLRRSLGELAAEARQRAADLEAQEDDLTPFQEYAKRQSSSGRSAMLNALAAQFAGEEFAPMQAHFLKQAMAAQDPVKIAGAVITPDGQILRDPSAARNRKIDRLEQQALTLDKADAEQQSKQALLALRQGQADDNKSLRLMQLDLQRQGLDLRRDVADKARNIPFGALQDLNKQAGSVDSLINLASSFKPNYASRMPGVPGVGSIENALGRAGIGDEARANWWQNYNEQANVLRNQLFGATLTAQEKAAFDAAMVSPEMAPDVILRRLDQQATAAQRAYEKIVASAQNSGYNASGLPQVQPFTPRSNPKLGEPPKKAAASGAPKGVDPALWQAMTPEERALWKN